MPAGAPGARIPSPVGVVAPEPGRELEPLSNEEPVLRDPRVELRMLKTPLLPNEKRPNAERRAEFIVPTDVHCLGPARLSVRAAGVLKSYVGRVVDAGLVDHGI